MKPDTSHVTADMKMKDRGFFEFSPDMETVAALCEVGSFFTHFDTKWRFLGHGREDAVIYCTDPTQNFPEQRDFNGLTVWADPERGLIARKWKDGTAGLRGKWSRDTNLALNTLYAPRDNDDFERRQWEMQVMPS